MKLLVIRETLIYFISLYYDYPRGMLTVNASPFPAIYDILKKWWYSCGTHHVNQRWLG